MKIEKIKDKAEYDLEINECKLKLGGKDERTDGKFVPNMNMSRWSDEVWFNMNHPDIVDTEVEKFKDDKIELIVGDNTHVYSIIGGTLAYKLVLAQRPPSDEVEFNIDFPDGLMFWFQPPLTQKEIDEGAVRPENVVGSYAVYWKKRDNKYKTGKFCHIFRPRLVDEWGEWIWAELEVESKKMKFKMDSDWLDNAHYPVTLG